VHFRDFLFETGVEEIPAGFIQSAAEFMEKNFKNELQEAKLTYQEIVVYSTPRRLAIEIKQVQDKQTDERIERLGPAKRIAVDSEGKLTKAGLGFLAGAAVHEDNMFIKSTEKGEYIAVMIEKKGKTAKEILSDVYIRTMQNLDFPKSMKWGERKESFARPVRWVIALCDEELIEIELFGVKSEKITYGNRFQKISSSLTICRPADYGDSLKSGFVIADREKRKRFLRREMDNLFVNSDLEMVEDEKLMDVVTDLVEFPTPVIANFNSGYLKLPEKIITSTLTQNQKCFAVRDRVAGKLTNKFVFVSNGNPIFSDIIRKGNEKVVTPRLEDAEFFFREDTKHTLESYYDKLDEVLFQKDLGTIKEKTERIVRLTQYICRQLSFSEKISDSLNRTAKLCKCDLVTQMLGEKEFTKLQGYIGKHYALVSGEAEDVAEGIYEHYMPRGQNDGLPASLNGAVVAIADKIDTVCGIIGVGLIPTSSNDPFAIRRAANGIVQIIREKSLAIDLFKLIDYSLEILEDRISALEKSREFLYSYFRQRVQWLLQQENIDYDVINSVMHIDFSDVVDLIARARDVQSFKNNSDFVKLVMGFKRVSNIIASEKDFSNFDEKKLTEGAEEILFKEFCKLEKNISKLLITKDYHVLLESLVNFSFYIDQFFDKVLVNTDDPDIRNNRYSLLFMIRSLFLKVADISKITIDGEKS